MPGDPRDVNEQFQRLAASCGYALSGRGSFLPEYIKKEILERDPFQTIDFGGVGANAD